MKKKSKKLLIPIILLIVIGTFIVVTIMPFSTYMPLSITQYDYVQNGEFGTTFRLFTSTIKGGERVIGTLDVENTDFRNTNEIPEKDFTIDIENSNKIEYQINNNFDRIQRYDVIVSDKYFCTSANLNHAQNFAEAYSKNAIRIGVKKASGSLSCRDFVLLRDNIGTIGDINNYNVRSISEVCIQPIGEASECVTIDNLGDSFQRTNRIKVAYAGGVSSGYGVDSIRSDSNRVMQPVYTGDWHMVEELLVNNYKINAGIMISTFDNIISDITNNNEWWDYPYKYIWDVKTEFRTNTQYVQQLEQGQAINTYNSDLKSFIFQNKYAETGTLLTAIPTENIIESQLIIDIDADWIGIERFTGKPSIISTSSEEWQSAVGDGHVIANVKNIGQNEGTFQATLNCEGIFIGASSQTLDLSAGQTKEFDVKFRTTGSCAENPSGYCNFVVEDVISGESDSERVSVSCKGTQICQPGTEICSPELNAIQECNNEGTKYETTTNCPSGTRCMYTDKGTPYCTGELEPMTCEELCEINYAWYSPERYTCKIKCGITDFFVSNIWFFVGFFFIVLIGIGGYIYIKVKF